MLCGRFPRYLAPEVIATGPTSPKPEVSSIHESVRPVMNSCKVNALLCCMVVLYSRAGSDRFALSHIERLIRN